MAKTDFMFSNCISLSNLDFSNFNTQNATNMNYMFYYCKSLTNFNTQNMTDMSCMFLDCNSLTNFNTQNVTDMSCMFNF